MQFTYKKECSLKEGQKLWGIIAVSIYTYDGVHPVTVGDIDWNTEEVIFNVDQPCGLVACTFEEMAELVWRTKAEAEEAQNLLEFGRGLYPYEYD